MRSGRKGLELEKGGWRIKMTAFVLNDEVLPACPTLQAESITSALFSQNAKKL